MGRIAVTMAAVGILGVAAESDGAVITLSDRNATASFDLESQAGMFAWVVDGVSQLAQHWIWYRLGGTDPEESISVLPLVGFTVTDTNPLEDPANDNLFVRYGTSGTFFVDVRYTLRGGSSAIADLAVILTITNQSGSPLDFHCFGYADLDLAGTPGGDHATLLDPSTVEVSGENGSVETTHAPAGDHYDLAFFPGTRDGLNDGSATTLADGPTLVGPGNVTWAFQWDRVLATGGAFTISEDMSLRITTDVPEPASRSRRLSVAPSPARGPVALRFSLPQPGGATLRVLDLAGREVRRFAVQGAGEQRIEWDGRGSQGRRLPAGVYLVELVAEELRATGRVVFAR